MVNHFHSNNYIFKHTSVTESDKAHVDDTCIYNLEIDTEVDIEV